MEKHERLLAYLLLLSFLGADLWLFTLLSGRPSLQLTLVVMGVVVYVLWGFWLHSLEDRLQKKVLVEYLLLGALVVLLFYIQSLV